MLLLIIDLFFMLSQNGTIVGEDTSKYIETSLK